MDTTTTHPGSTSAPAPAAVDRRLVRGLFAGLLAAGLAGGLSSSARSAEAPAAARFTDDVQPVLEQYCYGCHGLGAKKGDVTLDAFDDDESAVAIGQRKLWHNVLKNVRSGFMPPSGKPRPTAEEARLLENWIKFQALGIDPKDPDPGRVTVRRLNRVEYRNTVRDLLGVEFDTSAEFPPDDTGHGFDNIGDVLTLSPLLLEKYLTAANAVVAKAVPMVSKTVAENVIPGTSFRSTQVKDGAGQSSSTSTSTSSLSYYAPGRATSSAEITQAGRYVVVLDYTANERYVDGVNDYNRARIIFRVDGAEIGRREFGRQDGKPYRFETERQWEPGAHALEVEVQPLTPGENQVRSLSFRIQGVTVRGPLDPRFWVRPPGYERWFPGEVPDDPAGRRAYAREVLGKFAARAFRRPVDDATTSRLAELAEAGWNDDGLTFEAGIARGMAAVLTTPRFLFREETVEDDSGGRFPMVDEYSLASRLSYFLWSSMPDDELIRLASEHRLREDLQKQVARMLADPRSAEFFRNFVGQWLQARDIESVLINAQQVVARDQAADPAAENRRARFRELVTKDPETLTEDEKKELREIRSSFGRRFGRGREFELTRDLRVAMRRETEMLFEHIVRDDRSLLELLDCDYTFLNERLAKQYGIEGVSGDEMRKVSLPAGSPRGGILTQGTVLAVTSNPDRTSPVKRGLFLLDNVLGSPPPPPPPNIPSLEEAGKKASGRTPSLREAMALHRDQAMCASCHSRMDPLGLALENFNALGRFRDAERSGPIDASGKLITGEEFKDVRQLKRILVEKHRLDFYRCLTEKLLTYALGRGLEGSDVQTVDEIVGRIESGEGRASALVAGIVESVPFQKRRRAATVAAETSGSPNRSSED